MTTRTAAQQQAQNSKTQKVLNYSNVNYWNGRYMELSFAERIEQFYKDFGNKKILMTSSFGTSSALLLYWIAQLRPSQLVHFIDTTYHFQETIDYKNQLSRIYGLTVVDIKPDNWQNKISRKEHLFATDTERCCAINKINPLGPYKWSNDFWITGRMGFQTKERAASDIFEIKDEIIKFNPLIDMTEAEFLYYFGYYRLSAHPLKSLGYGSVGCTHCTICADGREGRWAGSIKTECGLH